MILGHMATYHWRYRDLEGCSFPADPMVQCLRKVEYCVLWFGLSAQLVAKPSDAASDFLD